MNTRTTVKTIEEAVTELQKQIQSPDYYMHNYRLIDGVKRYLDSCEDKADADFDEAEQIYNYVAYDLHWEERADEIFPMEL